MAIIKEMPGLKIISGFRGVLDFYYYMGVACVRRWPKSPGKQRSLGVQAGWAAFSYASREWNNLSPVVRRTYEVMSQGGALSARDIFSRAYLSGLYRNPTP